MSAVNRHKPHCVVLSEDKKTHALATGFRDTAVGSMDVRPFGRGWTDVVESFCCAWIDYLKQYPYAHLVMVIDFDKKPQARLDEIKTKVPQDISSRVYILGTFDEVETALSALGSLKSSDLGGRLAYECNGGKTSLWTSPHLACNQAELQRLQQSVKPFLF